MSATRYVLLVALSYAVVSEAHALMFTLTAPSIATTEGSNQNAARLQEILSAPANKFAGGHAVNWVSTMHFDGDTDALSTMLHDLAAEGTDPVTVTFSSSDAAINPVTHSFTVTHDSRRFTVMVNITSDQIDMTRLVLPPLGKPTGDTANEPPHRDGAASPGE